MSDNQSQLVKTAIGVTAGVVGAAAVAWVLGFILPKQAKKAPEVPFPLVHKTFKAALAAVPKDKIFGDFFYPNLFKNAPSAKDTFFHDTQFEGTQGQKMALASTVAAVLAMVEQGKLEPAFDALAQSGARHCAFMGPYNKSMDAAYDVVGQTLIQTITDLAGPELMDTAALEQWTKLYGVIVQKMVGGMCDEKMAAAPLKKWAVKRLAWFKTNAIDAKGGANGFAKAVVAAAKGADADVAAVEAVFGAAFDKAVAAESFAPLTEAAKAAKVSVTRDAILAAIQTVVIGDGKKPSDWEKFNLNGVNAAL